MNKLQYALQRAVEENPQYRGRDGRPSYRRAAHACRLSSNMISNYVKTPRPPLPTLETLQVYAEVFGWPLCDVVHWALDQEPPTTVPDYDPLREMRRAWHQLGIPERRQAALLTFIEDSLPEGAPPRSAYSP